LVKQDRSTNLLPTVRWLRQIVPFDSQQLAATTITDLAVLTKTLAKDHTVRRRSCHARTRFLGHRAARSATLISLFRSSAR
jgi:hypothetical protein